LSNAFLDTPWPKVVRARHKLATLLDAAGAAPPEDLARQLLDLLADRTIAPDNELPDTGVGLDLERLLSPICIVTETYGTRCSTVLLRTAAGIALLVERTLEPGSDPPVPVEERIQRLEPA
jgi:uncharacterized protein with NRDE domain